MKTLYHAVATASLTVILIAMGLVEIRWHLIERFVGSYMEARNESRDRLDRFVDQEVRTNQALEHANELIEQRSQEAMDLDDESRASMDRSAPGSEIVRLERGHKLIMTRERFLAGPDWFVQVDLQTDAQASPLPNMQTELMSDVQAEPISDAQADIPPDSRPDSLSAAHSDSLSVSATLFEPDSLKNWTRTVVICPGWIRKGEVYLVDDDNYILHRMPISVDQFNLIDAYTTAAEGRMHEGMEHVYRPRLFFNTLRSLDTEMRDEIIDPLRFRNLEATAQRIGVSENQRIIQIERLIDGRIDVVTIPVSADLFVELYVALGVL